MPIVDISGLSASEERTKIRIRQRVQEFYHNRLGIPMDATTVTFMTDHTAGDGPSVHVMARLYSKKFMTMKEGELDEIADSIVLILEEEAGHDFNEALVIPVMAMRGRKKPVHVGPTELDALPAAREFPDLPPGVPRPDWRSYRAFKGHFVSPAALTTEEVEELLQDWTKTPREELRTLLVENQNRPTSLNWTTVSPINKILRTKPVRGNYYRLVTEQGVACLWHVIPD